MYTFSKVSVTEAGIDIEVDGLDCGISFPDLAMLRCACDASFHPIMKKIGEYADNLEGLVGVSVG